MLPCVPGPNIGGTPCSCLGALAGYPVDLRRKPPAALPLPGKQRKRFHCAKEVPGDRYNRGMLVTPSLIRPETTALVVIDLQQKLVPAIETREEVLQNTKQLIRLAQTLDLRTLMTTQYRQGLGETVPEIAELAGLEPIDKVCFGCLGDDAFRATLSETILEGGTLLLAGIEAHICVMQTALGALDEGYRVHVAEDAVGSRSATNKAAGIERMRGAGAVISSTEMAIYELLGRSSRAEFKAMLPHLK